MAMASPVKTEVLEGDLKFKTIFQRGIHTDEPTEPSADIFEASVNIVSQPSNLSAMILLNIESAPGSPLLIPKLITAGLKIRESKSKENMGLPEN